MLGRTCKPDIGWAAGVQENEPGKQRDMEANASKHASPGVCMRVRVRVRVSAVGYKGLLAPYNWGERHGHGIGVVVR